MKRILIALIRFYQTLSRLIPVQAIPLIVFSGCRSWPTCSDYSVNAIEQYGVLRGGFMSLARLARCHPWSTSH